MITYYHERPLPRCKTCAEEMPYWVPGLADAEHEHDKCWVARTVAKIFAPCKRRKDDEP